MDFIAIGLGRHINGCMIASVGRTKQYDWWNYGGSEMPWNLTNDMFDLRRMTKTYPRKKTKSATIWENDLIIWTVQADSNDFV